MTPRILLFGKVNAIILAIFVARFVLAQEMDLIDNIEPGRKGKIELALSHIESDSLYAEMGLKEGDVIRDWNGKKITKHGDWDFINSDLYNAKQFTVVVERDGQTQILRYTKTVDDTKRFRPPAPTFGGYDRYIFRNVKRNSFFEMAGLKIGDILKKWNGREIVTPYDMTFVTDSMKNSKEFTIVIERDGKEQILHYVKK